MVPATYDSSWSTSSVPRYGPSRTGTGCAWGWELVQQTATSREEEARHRPQARPRSPRPMVRPPPSLPPLHPHPVPRTRRPHYFLCLLPPATETRRCFGWSCLILSCSVSGCGGRLDHRHDHHARLGQPRHGHGRPDAGASAEQDNGPGRHGLPPKPRLHRVSGHDTVSSIHQCVIPGRPPPRWTLVVQEARLESGGRDQTSPLTALAPRQPGLPPV